VSTCADRHGADIAPSQNRGVTSTIVDPCRYRASSAPRAVSRRGAALPALALAGLLGGAPGDAAAVEAPTGTVTVHMVSHGWHSGLVIPAAVIDGDAWPARREFPDAEHFEVGWGDRAYYQASDPGLWAGLRALLWPSPGVLHIVALRGAPVSQHPGAPMATLDISREGAQRLVAAIAASHERDAEGQPIAFGPSLYGQGRFYASREHFHLFATCNVWVASRLRDAGVAMRPALALTTGLLFAQLPQSPMQAPEPLAPLPVQPPASAPSTSRSSTAAN